jgi:hypothetical protein
MKTANDIAGQRSPLREGKLTNEPIELVYGASGFGHHCVRSTHVTLVGILNNGTAYLYLSQDQVLTFRSGMPRKSIPASQFVSLSPVFYLNEMELVLTLEALTPKYKKGYDDSPLNKILAMPTVDPRVKEVIKCRAVFEQQRHVWNLDIKHSNTD